MPTRSLSLPILAAAAVLLAGCAQQGPPSPPPALTLLHAIPCGSVQKPVTPGPATVGFDAQGNVEVAPDTLVINRGDTFRWQAAQQGLRWAVEVPDTLVARGADRKFANAPGRAPSGTPRPNATCGYYKYAVSAYLVTAGGDTLFDVADPEIMVAE